MAVAQDRPHAGGADPAAGVATVLAAKWAVLLRVYGDRLPYEDLEDCLGQAALELVTRARADGLQGERHIANALEQKFVSRIIDRQRALGRRPATITSDTDTGEGAATDDEPPAFEIVAPDGEPSDTASTRHEIERLREVAAELTDDQRLVLACQVSLGMDSTEFCERFGWSPEKFRKVAQRARGRLRTLLAEYELGERCQRLEADVLTYAADAAAGAQSTLVREHLANCMGCAAMVRDVRLASNRVGALLPVPALAKAGLGINFGIAAKVGAIWRAFAEPIGRVWQGAGSGGMDNAGPLVKAGVATLCAASLAGGRHWVAPNIAHRGDASAHASSHATRSVAAPAPRVPPQVAARTEPTVGPAALLKQSSVGAARSRRTKRRRSTGSHRQTTPTTRRSQSPPVTPPSSPAVRPPVRPPPPTAAAPPPAAPRPSHSASSTEFGVE
jgi:RNA polymerase sigma factor (sigma-70 family)